MGGNWGEKPGGTNFGRTQEEMRQSFCNAFLVLPKVTIPFYVALIFNDISHAIAAANMLASNMVPELTFLFEERKILNSSFHHVFHYPNITPT